VITAQRLEDQPTGTTNICEMREDLQGPFKLFKNELSGIFEDLIKIKVRKEYEKLKSWTTNMHFPSSIQNGFQFEQDKIANLIRTYEEALKKDIVSIENRALMGNASSFIRAQMKSTYSLAAQDSGRGVRKRQAAIIRGRISGTLFQDIMKALDDEMTMTIKGTLEKIQVNVSRSVKRFTKDLLSALDGDNKSVDTNSPHRGLIYTAREKLQQELNQLKASFDSKVLPAIS